MKGEYSILISGPEGVVLSARVDLEKRDVPRALLVEDGRLKELFVLNAMCDGWIAAALELKGKGEGHA